MKSPLYYIGVGTITLSITAIMYAAYLMFWPVTVVSISNNPYPIITPVVTQGQALTFESKFCAYGTYTGQIVRYLVDANDGLTLLNPTAYTTTPGCQDIHSYVTIPDTVPPGSYVLHNIGTYQVNPLHTITVLSETQVFKVLSNNKQK